MSQEPNTGAAVAPYAKIPDSPVSLTEIGANVVFVGALAWAHVQFIASGQAGEPMGWPLWASIVALDAGALLSLADLLYRRRKRLPHHKARAALSYTAFAVISALCWFFSDQPGMLPPQYPVGHRALFIAGLAVVLAFFSLLEWRKLFHHAKALAGEAAQ